MIGYQNLDYRISHMNDSESLQHDLDSPSSWSYRWLLLNSKVYLPITENIEKHNRTTPNGRLLRFNPDKCKVMHIKHEIHTSYSIKQDGKKWPLQEVSEEKDLGIVTTND